jgi:hypothetical protein
MLGLILQTHRCPDGVEVHERFFQFCSDRRENLRMEIRDLKNPVVVHFLNARDDEARTKFFSEYGLMQPDHSWTTLPMVLAWQDRFGQLLDHIRNNKPAEVAEAISTNVGWRPDEYPPSDWALRLQVARKKTNPQMYFECRSLISFMAAETAMIVANEDRVRYCQHCHKMFLTGPLTGRRAHAKFDSDRCRAAAMRARQKT